MSDTDTMKRLKVGDKIYQCNETTVNEYTIKGIEINTSNPNVEIYFVTDYYSKRDGVTVEVFWREGEVYLTREDALQSLVDRVNRNINDCLDKIQELNETLIKNGEYKRVNIALPADATCGSCKFLSEEKDLMSDYVLMNNCNDRYFYPCTHVTEPNLFPEKSTPACTKWESKEKQ